MWNDTRQTSAWIECASQLLAAALRLRTSATHPDPRGLTVALSEALIRCNDLASAEGAPEPAWSCARLLVCRRLDEAIASTPWGADDAAMHDLQRRFGGAASDAQIVALVDDWIAEGGRTHRPAMTLLHAAMALAMPGGAPSDATSQRLDDARSRLAARLRDAEPAAAPQSPSSAGLPSLVPLPAPRLRDFVPVWVLAAIGAVAMTLLFIALRISINADSDPVFASLRAVDVSAADLPASSPALSPAVTAALAPRLATFLKQDIDAGLVLVNDMPDKSIVTIRSDSFFEPGSAVIADPDRMFPLMGRIAAGLNAVPGQALVAGYTDTRPDHSVLYPSNWHLSQDRANVVTSILAESVDPHRLTAQGRADSEPVGDNATPQGRSDNRRVDITLVVGQPS